jgi:hypothetical protein
VPEGLVWWIAAAHAGAWTRSVGEGYAKAGVEVYRASTFVPPGAGRPSGGSYVAEQGVVWAEAGLLPADAWRVQVAVGTAVIAGHHRAEVTSVLGSQEIRATSVRPGDLRVVPQVALHPAWPVALALEAKLPLYRNDGVGGDSTWAELFPKPGDGQLDLTPTAWAGGGRGRAFAEVGLGWRHRTALFVGWTTPTRFRDAAVGSLKVGLDLGRVTPIVTLDAVRTLIPDDVSRESVTLAATALVDVVDGRIAVEPRAAVEPWTRNAARGVSAGIGVSARR